MDRFSGARALAGVFRVLALVVFGVGVCADVLLVRALSGALWSVDGQWLVGLGVGVGVVLASALLGFCRSVLTLLVAGAEGESLTA
jgi:hypothetical protein